MYSTLTPTAQSRYDAYVDHIRQCTQCPTGPERCAEAEALVRAYLADVKPQR